MNSLSLTRSRATIESAEASRSQEAADAADRSQATQRRGKALVVAGWVVTVVAAVLYCVTCFAGGVDADVSEILSTNVVPFARAMLLLTGVGTLLWLAGSFIYLKGAMDAEPTAAEGEDEAKSASRGNG